MKKSLLLGGVRSGKSSLAETLVAGQADPVVYVATATAGDEEMSDRIRRHQRRRPSRWGLVEEPVGLGRLLTRQATLSPPPCVLIDCMSLWVSNLLHAGDTVFVRERDHFLAALERYPGNVVIVSNEVGLGIIGMDPLTRRFADELGWLNQSLARRCDNVLMTIAGITQTLKGGE
ncbi:bifunctional adenosylcobinamide kinase/adenosylcobinamide-phosphate guanylyltransferase [Alcanivorax sp. DP30]|uniref:bifunctional adenosylcobinamide kinase/adenosylcobinamide-phosphate guanylyltransferase n=1 Tax=Alcanivorax sp. DP30 TaxID=2606217 RepID=UPI001368B639|nr:bifunctional adenosylcobinamide kinase/adenosylcobinamide-phosphate guanylyltransferase [Alcanivorax sp. DP30]MZR64475.1 bifunctional adenosylcobinamide kinase/adenosylcobinamide-phosphate guanylyltransferase [Alcanivorax sp. DP30]